MFLRLAEEAKQGNEEGPDGVWVAPGVCEIGSGSSTLKRRMRLLFSIRCRALPRIALAACAGLCLTLYAAAKEAKVFSAATLVEAANYLPCGDGCSALTDTASAFCFRQGDQVLLGEGRSYLHEGRFSGLEELAGKQLQLRFNRRFLWIRMPDGAVMKLRRGSEFENFNDSGCASAVHGPILDAAYAQKRPAKVPADAFPLAGSGKDDPFLWYRCNLDSDKTTISCQRWYKNGDVYGKDWYCAQTMAGEPVGAVATLDPLLSRDGRLVLKSGGALRHDNRARTNDVLDRPGEACR